MLERFNVDRTYEEIGTENNTKGITRYDIYAFILAFMLCLITDFAFHWSKKIFPEKDYDLIEIKK